MLRLSNLADYGVVVMTAAARAADDGRLASSAQIAQLTAIPAPTVAKLMGLLGRAGLLLSQRGVGGGFALARNPRDISLADIVEAIDGPISLTHCGQPGAECCSISAGCLVRPHWTPVNRAVRQALAGVSLAELAPADAPLAEPAPAGAPLAEPAPAGAPPVEPAPAQEQTEQMVPA